MKEQYETDDLILSTLTFARPTKARVVLDTKYIRLYVGPQDWQWDRDTGELVGVGYGLGGGLPIKEKASLSAVPGGILKEEK